jgi:RimJ/RimL family protein N-acetyltransferase
MTQPTPLMILIAGPYRSGANGDPGRMAENVRVMEKYALPLFRAGHTPIVGEWIALPLIALAGSARVGDTAFDEIFDPVAERLVTHCDAVLRVGGASKGADDMVEAARARGLAVFQSLREVPGLRFDLQPTLRGELLELRPLADTDFDALFAVGSDPLIWEQHPQSDRWQEEVFREFFRGAMSSGGAFLVTDARDGRVIGSSRYHAYDPDASEIEIGWTFLARECWGGTYNAEMKRLMLDHAFQFVERVVLLIGESNFRSQRAAEKIGAVRKGTRFEASSGRERLVFEISKQAWRQAAMSRLSDPSELSSS